MDGHDIFISKRLMREFFKNNCRYLFAYISEAFNDHLRSFISSLARHSNMKTKTVLWHICDTSEHLMCYSIYAVGTSHIKYYKKGRKIQCWRSVSCRFFNFTFYLTNERGWITITEKQEQVTTPLSRKTLMIKVR